MPRNRLIEESIIDTLDYWVFATPREIGETLGADKFLVLGLLNKMAMRGIVEVVSHPTLISKRHDANLMLFAPGVGYYERVVE